MTRKTAAPLTPDLLARKGQANAAAWRDGAGQGAGGLNVVTLTARSSGPSSEHLNQEPVPAPKARAARWHWPALALILVLGIAGGMTGYVLFSAPTADSPAPLAANDVTPDTKTAEANVAVPVPPAAVIPPPPVVKTAPPQAIRAVPPPMAKAPPLPVPIVPPAAAVKVPAPLVAKAPPLPRVKGPAPPVAKAPPLPAVKVPVPPVAKAPAKPAVKGPAPPVDAGALRLAAGPATPVPPTRPVAAKTTAKSVELSSLPPADKPAGGAAKAVPHTTAAPKTPPPVATRTAKPAKPATPKPVAARSPFTVQFASLKSRAAANREWTRLKTRFTGLLAGFKPTVQRAAVARRGVFYRLRAGEFSTGRAARTLCKALQAKRQPCLVIRR